MIIYYLVFENNAKAIKEKKMYYNIHQSSIELIAKNKPVPQILVVSLICIALLPLPKS